MSDLAAGTRFAVYVVPPATDPFYQLGTRLLGYDLRARRSAAFPEFVSPAWQTEAGPYGFHLTVVEGFYTEAAHLSAIEQEVRACLACLSPDAELTLTGGQLEDWDGGKVWVQRFEPSPALLVVQTLLLARLAPFVSASPFADKPRRPYEDARMRLLFTPRGLDTYQPHFTLMEPYGGDDPEGLRARLSALTQPYDALKVEALSLCLKPAGEKRWQIRNEIALPYTPSKSD